MSSIPVIDISPMISDSGSSSVQSVAGEIRRACRDSGFFYITGHGISVNLQTRLETLSQQFFAMNTDAKMSLAM